MSDQNPFNGLGGMVVGGMLGEPSKTARDLVAMHSLPARSPEDWARRQRLEKAIDRALLAERRKSHRLALDMAEIDAASARADTAGEVQVGAALVCSNCDHGCMVGDKECGHCGFDLPTEAP